MKSEIRFWILVSLLVLVILAVAFPSCGGQDDETQLPNAQVCFPHGKDIMVSNGTEIPNMRIVETKTFVMVSKTGRSNLCNAAVAFMEEVKRQGGNATIGFSSMVITDAAPRTVIAFYGTAVVVEPLDGQRPEE